MEQTRIDKDKCSYQPGWTNETSEISNSSIDQAFQYGVNEELDDSGGYIYEFRGRLSDLQSNLSLLHQLEWINRQTRAVIIQFSLYNPNVELFSSITLLVEFLSTGGLDPQSRFEPFSFQCKVFTVILSIIRIFFYYYLVFSSISQLVCSILYMILIIYLIIEQVQSMIELKIKYFYQFWCYIDIGIILCSWTSVGIYIWRYFQVKHISDLFRETNGYVYINLQWIVYVNDLFIYLISFCCFFGWIKLIRLGRFNRRILIFIKTIQHARKDLLSFSIIFSIIFISFLCLFYLLFISKLSTCSSLLETAEMLFKMLLMNFDAYQLINASTFLGPFCFSLFIVLVVFICLSMFITIINKNFRFVRHHMKHHHQNEDEQIFRFMFRKFRRWIGRL